MCLGYFERDKLTEDLLRREKMGCFGPVNANLLHISFFILIEKPTFVVVDPSISSMTLTEAQNLDVTVSHAYSQITYYLAKSTLNQLASLDLHYQTSSRFHGALGILVRVGGVEGD